MAGTKLRENIIQAAIIWRKTDGANLEFTEATGNLTIAVAEYLQELESGDAPDKLLKPQPVFEYIGRIYVRPLGRGITLEDAPYNGNDLEEQLSSGYYEAEIVINPPNKPLAAEGHPVYSYRFRR